LMNTNACRPVYSSSSLMVVMGSLRQLGGTLSTAAGHGARR